MDTELRAGLVGVTGDTGMELVRLLVTHPGFRLNFAASRAESGKRLGDHYPFLEKLPGADIILNPPDAKQAAEQCDIVFLAVPHGAAMRIAGELRAAGVRVVDLSADFRLKDAEVYEQWYATPHNERRLLEQAVYGLPELYAEAIADAGLVANPGCYPTASVLGLYAALRHNLIHTNDIIIDAKAGASGLRHKGRCLLGFSCKIRLPTKILGQLLLFFRLAFGVRQGLKQAIIRHECAGDDRAARAS